MRVTQSMMTANSMKHLSSGYGQMMKYQDQLSSGKKISRASQDPVVAMNGIRYRTQVTETGQFKRNLSEAHNWMDTSDATLDKATNSLHRVRELTVQASNDSYEAGQRSNIAKEVAQLREHLASLANTRNNNKYMFNGTDTTNAPVDTSRMDIGFNGLSGVLEGDLPEEAEDFPLDVMYKGNAYAFQGMEGDSAVFTGPDNETISFTIEDGSVTGAVRSFTEDGTTRTESLPERSVIVSHKDAVSTNGRTVSVELMKGTNVDINVNPQAVFGNQLFADLKALENALEHPDTTASELSGMLDVLDKHVNNSVNERAELGARMNRVEMIDRRVQEQEVIAKRIMSDNEDVEMEEAIMNLMTAENVHRAALSSGARIMQPSLMDFLR
ncbi:flagellar hook-associated protein FlgL [Alkalicoccus luteus]|uniref:Flagellar hook-associated protein 3 n=1 Tax=Alkalicoccus luteus TaxID=1237094 RepID=A0A969PT41_9BACI|nr:flagellar hook-associated protein FlgL [Alkalicoccus luteus]NJP37054.1 flagellar hook-associated protein 3 [Alkalicoccus luteus]